MKGSGHDVLAYWANGLIEGGGIKKMVRPRRNIKVYKGMLENAMKKGSASVLPNHMSEFEARTTCGTEMVCGICSSVS